LDESNTLAEIGRALSETERVGTDKVLQLIVNSARDLIQHADESVIHFIGTEGDVLIPRAISGFDAGAKVIDRSKMRLREGVAGHVINTGKTINIGDISTSPLYVLKERTPTYQSLLVSPVQSGGKLSGTISVQSNKLNAFSEQDVKLLNSLSVQASIAIENTHLFETTQQSLKEVNALYRTSQGLASSLTTDELIDDVVNLLHKNFGYYHVQIYLSDPLSDDLLLKSGSGEIGPRMLKEDNRLPRGTGVAGHTVETGLPFVTNNVNAIMFFFRSPLLPDTQSEMTVPIKVDGKVVGVLDIQDRPPNRFTDNDLQLMVAVADQLSVGLQKASLYENLQTALQQEQTVRSQLMQSERLALVGRLLASVSHELNNPLQAIQNALFLLKDEEQFSKQGRQDLDVILSEAERMASLIERLRSAYRPGRSKDFRAVDLNNLIEDEHTLITTHMRQKQIAFECYPEPGLPPISGVPDQIRQVVLNLFINAVEVMDVGGRLTVRTQSLIQQNEILLTVKDTGPGIAVDILPHIFDPFITDKQTGTGLGLTITHDIIEQHFGRIKAENDPQGGAIFSIWLPIHNEKGRQ
ncbi:MAG TPA: GAF domain-containing protein, partial [Anaerolineales bacterium]|nr:GAF domain-containing protein [Anaerolineales bacterium]